MAKLIPLTQGKFAIVDDDNFDRLNQYKWYAWSKGRGYPYYALRNVSRKQGRGIIRMHREILDIPTDLIPDHKDGNGLNNQRSNLRVVNNSLNLHNQHKPKAGTSSAHLGVSWNKINKKWIAQIQINKKYRYLGSFEKEIEASNAYLQAKTKNQLLGID